MEQEQRIVTVMGKALGRGGVAPEELVDRCRTAARVMGEVEGALVIPTGGDPAQVSITEAKVMRACGIVKAHEGVELKLRPYFLTLGA